MERRDLRRLLKMGLSYREIAARTGQSKSNVRYWAGEHGLQSEGAKRSGEPRLTKREVAKAVRANVTAAGTIRALGRKKNGGNYTTLYQLVEQWDLDTSHWLGLGHRRGCKGQGRKPIPLAEVMVENSTYSRQSLKRRLLEDGLLKNRCSECRLPPKWNGKKLVLVLDHINGVNNDHRMENLRLLCPNCNSQTPTFAGKNVKR